MLTTLAISANDLSILGEDPYFSPLVPLFKKFGILYDDGSAKVNLRKPVMPSPEKTKWNLLPFNEFDCLIDLVWDLFLKHGEQYQKGVGIFDTLRVHIPCLVLTQDEKDMILGALYFSKDELDGTLREQNLEVYQSILRKLG